MESQYVATKLQTVLFQAEDANAACFDGELAVLGDFTQDPVYLNAFSADDFLYLKMSEVGLFPYQLGQAGFVFRYNLFQHLDLL